MSDVDTECVHGLDTRWCGVCKHGPTKPETPTIVATFRARYDGECGGCSLPITPGQVIHSLTNDRYVHDGCQP